MPGSAATSQLEERHDPSRAANVWWTVAVVTIGAFMLILDLTVVNVALPRLRVALNANFPDLQWVIDAYELTLAAFLLPAGSVADRLGRRRVFTLGFLVFTAASLSCGLSPGILVLAISRAVQGVGGAILFAVGPALIGQAIQGKARAAAFGVFGAGMGLAIATGPLIGGALTSGLSWRWIFLVNIPVGVAGTVLGRLRMRESLATGARDVDWAGLAASITGLACIVCGLLRGGDQGWTSPPILTGLVAGGALLVAFVLLEKAKKSGGMLDLTLFRIRTFAGLSVIALLLNAGALAAIFLLVLYVQDALGLSPWQTGLRFLPMTGVTHGRDVSGCFAAAAGPDRGLNQVEGHQERVRGVRGQRPRGADRGRVPVGVLEVAPADGRQHARVACPRVRAVGAARHRPPGDPVRQCPARDVVTAGGGQHGLDVVEVPGGETVAVALEDGQAFAGELAGFLPLPGQEIIQAQVDQGADVPAGRAARAPLPEQPPGVLPEVAEPVR
jgi:MFS family permease